MLHGFDHSFISELRKATIRFGTSAEVAASAMIISAAIISAAIISAV